MSLPDVDPEPELEPEPEPGLLEEDEDGAGGGVEDEVCSGVKEDEVVGGGGAVGVVGVKELVGDAMTGASLTRAEELVAGTEELEGGTELEDELLDIVCTDEVVFETGDELIVTVEEEAGTVEVVRAEVVRTSEAFEGTAMTV